MERKLKRYGIEPSQLLGGYLRRFRNWPSCIRVAKSSGPPDGAKFEEIWFDQNRRCFVVMVSHDSFSEVPAGEEIPDAEDLLNVQEQVLIRCHDGAYRLPGNEIHQQSSLVVDWHSMSTENLQRMRDDINAILYDRDHLRP